MENVAEKNKLIKGFMNDSYEVEGRITFLYTSDEEFPFSGKPFSYNLILNEVENEVDEFGSTLTAQIFSYHNSWDWLMPVIRKICDICFADDESETVDSERYYIIVDQIPNIESTYESVVSFIEEYNKNQLK